MSNEIAQIREVGPVGPTRIPDLVGESRSCETVAQICQNGLRDGDAERFDVHPGLLRFRQGEQQPFAHLLCPNGVSSLVSIAGYR
jgi:hypothetical protein